MGTTGIVTKIGIKLFANRGLKDVDIFVIEDPQPIPDILCRVSGLQAADDILVSVDPKGAWAEWACGFQSINISYSADTEEQLVWKRDLFRAALRKYIDQKIGGFMALTASLKTDFGLLEEPMKSAAVFADVKRGGGYEYAGNIMPIDLFPMAYQLGIDIAERHGIASYLVMAARVVGQGHCMMFAYTYAFNRADASDMERTRKALEETNCAVLEIGGIPWKAETSAQREIIKRMTPNTFALMKRLRAVLDPNGIMNPGNWEVE